jgi:molecular chaperone GrpE
MMPKEPKEKENTNNENTPPEESPGQVPREPSGQAPEVLPEATINLEEALAEEKKRAKEYLASWQRAQADLINYKRRSEQERMEFNSYANANLCNNILPVVDDLERALAAIPEEYSKTNWVEGVRLVERKFKTILEGQGVKPICALGMAFDPNLHEAIRHEKGKEGMVIAEYQKGYMLNDKLLRPSRVGVGSGEEEKHHKPHTKEAIKEEEKEEPKSE